MGEAPLTGVVTMSAHTVAHCCGERGAPFRPRADLHLLDGVRCARPHRVETPLAMQRVFGLQSVFGIWDGE